TLVRLDGLAAVFQSHTGSIQRSCRPCRPTSRYGVSIPHWFDSTADSAARRPSASSVSIPHWFDSTHRRSVDARRGRLGFNPTLVRFNVLNLPQKRLSTKKFQSHTGSIQRPEGERKVLEAVMFQSHTGSIQRRRGSNSARCGCLVSIPHWFDSTSICFEIKA